MGPGEVVGWMLMLMFGLHLRLMNAAISLIPTAASDMTRSVPPAQIRCLDWPRGGRGRG